METSCAIKNIQNVEKILVASAVLIKLFTLVVSFIAQ